MRPNHLGGTPLGCCPLCGSELDPWRGFAVDGKRYARCRGCLADVATLLPDTCESKAFYRERYYGIFGASDASPRRLAMLRLLLRKIPRRPPGRWLDVGCGAGHLLAMARGAGWDVTGVDPSVEACNLARESYSLKVMPTTLEDADLPEGAFEVVTLINVLDQVPNPVALLAAVRRVLGMNGLLVVRVPNGPFHRFAWGMIRHAPTALRDRLRLLTIFHPFSLGGRALHSLLARAGFVHIHINNASISGADWYSPRGIVTRTLRASCGAAARALVGAAAVLTVGHLLCSPSLLAFAERENVP